MRRGSTLAVVLTALAVLLAAAAVFGVLLVVRPRPPAPAPAPTPATPPAPALARRTPGRSAASYEAAMAEARGRAEAIIRGEPAETERVLAGVSLADRAFARRAMRQPELLHENRARLHAIGLGVWALRASYETALADPEFPAFVARVWQADEGADHILRVMAVWGGEPPAVRREFVDAVLKNKPLESLGPLARDFLQEVAPDWADARTSR